MILRKGNVSTFKSLSKQDWSEWQVSNKSVNRFMQGYAYVALECAMRKYLLETVMHKQF